MPIEEPATQEPKITVEPATGEKPVIKVEPPQLDYEKKKKIIRNKQLIWYILLVIEVLLALRFVLKLLGANPASVFSILVYITTLPFVIIFTGVFPSSVSPTGNIVLEWSTLFAMFVYAVIAFLISFFYRLKKPINPKEAEEKADQTIP